MDLDLVLEGGVAELATELVGDALIHERFGTAELVTEDGTRVDLATSRRESYQHPGALPKVEPAPIETDLLRRDFTINAMAAALTEPQRLIDPSGGLADLERGVLRVLHPDSFRDDPTRALRAARYCARFGFDLDPRTAELLNEVDLSSVSTERIEAELELIAAEESGLEALRLAAAWGLVEISEERLEHAACALLLLDEPRWKGRTTHSSLLLSAAFGKVVELPEETPATPYEAVCLTRGLTVENTLVARASGVQWLDSYVDDWAQVRPSITGDDLVAAGIAQGPAVGAGLEAALRARLNGNAGGIQDELRVAVAAAEEFADGSVT